MYWKNFEIWLQSVYIHELFLGVIYIFYVNDSHNLKIIFKNIFKNYLIHNLKIEIYI